MKKVVLIACCSKKLSHRARAQDIYQSELFIRSLSYAKRMKPDTIHILSAKYGLLDLDTEIEPYDVTLSRMSAADNRRWAETVLEQLRARASVRDDHFIILAGDRYRRHIIPYLASYEVPLRGLPIGKQLQFLGAPR